MFSEDGSLKEKPSSFEITLNEDELLIDKSIKKELDFFKLASI